MRSRSADYRFAPPPAIAAIAIAVVAAVHLYVAMGAAGPFFQADEVSMLGNARVIALGSADWQLAGAAYMPGLAVLLAPVWWLTSDPYVAYQAALLVGVALAVIAVWPLSRLARWAGATPTGSIVIAAVVMLAPARTVPSNYVLAETLLVITTSGCVLAAIRMQRRRSLGSALLFGFAVGSVVLSHGRGVAIALACGLWCLWWLTKDWRLALVAGSVATATSLGAYGALRWVESELYYAGDRVGSTFRNPWQGFGEVLGVGAGEAWYAVVAWPAVVLVGGALLARRGRFDTVPALLGGMTALSLALVVIQVSHDGVGSTFTRLDTWIYGRYLDHLFTVVAVIGLAALVRVRSWVLVASTLAAAVIIVTAFQFATVPRMVEGGYWIDVHIAGVSHLLSLDAIIEGRSEPWALFSLVAVVITALVLIASRIKYAGLLVLALLWVGISLANDASRVDPRDDYYRTNYRLGELLDSLPDNVPIGIDAQYPQSNNLITFWATPRPVGFVDISQGDPGVDVVLSPAFNPIPAEAGAWTVSGDYYGSFTYWVYPGSLFDDLSREGLLTPPPEADED
ncbi:ArnT family glycosyltransferase [Demequina muriae]|uniref:Glycosyltransferase RgtA/B/C/D-like domain-containing protein n=1 Tax=Demequina muriae TaxID=3051664 RepID=A0ABT8GKB6_9MICO|nr:hypothetical protein [Demequina sp. EGI L300058]MDN4481684.1 hypothetical protein [Demequina sp. EGI L300058]